MKSFSSIFLNFIFFLFCLILLFYPQDNLQAQEKNIEVLIQPKKKNIINNEIISLLIQVKNQGQKEINAIAEVNSSFPILSKKTQKINIPPGGHIFIPVKVFSRLSANDEQAYYATLAIQPLDDQIIDQNLISSDTCFFKVTKSKSIQILIPENETLFTSKHDTVQLPIRLINNGNTTEEIRIIARLPFSITAEDFSQIAKISLLPFSDTLIYYTIKSNRSLMKKSSSTIKLTGLYQDGNIFGFASFSIKTAKNNRSYSAEKRAQNQFNEIGKGRLSFLSNYLFGTNEYYQFNAKNTIILQNKDQIHYNIDATYWRHGNQPILLKNTYLNYENNQMGLTLGNLNRNLDLNLSGKGIAAQLNDLKKENTLEIGYVKNGYNLLGDRYSEDNQAFWGNFIGNYQDFLLNAYIVNQQVPFSRSNISLMGVSLNLWDKNNNNEVKNKGLELQVGLGNTIDQAGMEKARQGYSLSLNYQKNLGKYRFNSRNSYGSAYYPGQKRGLVAFDERISKNINKNANMWFGFSYENSDPEQLPGGIYSQWKRGFSSSQFGYFRQLSNSISLAVSGKYYKEKNNYASLIGLSSSLSSLTGTLMELTGSYSNPFSNLQFYFNIEGGFFETSFQQGQIGFHHKNNLSIRYKCFSITTDYRSGYFSVVDLVNAERNQKKEYQSYSISPSIEKDFLKGRLKSCLRLGWNGNNLYGNTMNVMFNISYQFSKSSMVMGSFTQTRFNQNNYQLNNLSLGYTQQLPTHIIERNQDKDLSVFVFYDYNSNGQFDAGDMPAPDQLIIINNQLLNTDSKGKVNYRNLPIGNYEIQIRNKNTWIGKSQYLDLKQDTSISIPLIQIGKVSGSLIFSSNKFSVITSANLGGMTITALNKNGQEFETRTDSKGNFTFFLQEDQYTIFIKKENLNPLTESTLTEKKIVVDKSKNQFITFEIKAKEMTYETKKFYSQNSKKRK